ncbi:MAG: hypothetical protein R3F48_17120 [Candidatus Zixiibacteriota bacterium]
MDMLSSVRVDFDKQKNIIHIGFGEEVTIHTENELYAMYGKFEQYLKSLGSDRRYYLVIDMSNLIINQNLAHQYAMEISRLSKKYLHDDGIARYGYQMTRIVVKRAHEEYLNKDPRLFGNKKEAYDYIESLIEPEERPEWIETTSLMSTRSF